MREADESLICLSGNEKAWKADRVPIRFQEAGEAEVRIQRHFPAATCGTAKFLEFRMPRPFAAKKIEIFWTPPIQHELEMVTSRSCATTRPAIDGIEVAFLSNAT
jgi:hypothetical protein